MFGGLLQILTNLLDIAVQDLQGGMPHQFGERQDIHTSTPAFNSKRPAKIVRGRNWYTGPGSTPYTAKVTFFDAWGNSASASSSFTVYPW